MKYVFNEDYNLPIEDRILSINNIKKDNLDISKYSFNSKVDVIESFKDCLLKNKDKKFLIVGDYDCDGICATAIMVKLFKDISIDCNYYIPSRTKEGYGLNNAIVNNAHNNGFDCILCVDNGVAASSQIEYAKSLGIETYIIDHHEYACEPKCIGFIHPNILGEDYNDMCAGGLCSLVSNSFRYDELTTVLGGIATLADMVSVLGFNRYLLDETIKILSIKRITPINLLLGSSEITYTNIQYNVIPKINSVSRLDDLLNVNYVVKYLLSDGPETHDYFTKIETINNSRKELSTKMFNKARNIVDSSKNIITIFDEEFKEGICGLIANKLVEEFNKPAIVFARNGNELKGSGRCIPGFNLYEYISNIKEILSTFGGHEQAIGLSLDEDKYNSLLQYIESNPITINETYKDVIMLDDNNLSEDLLSKLNSLFPFGTNFKEPLFGINSSKVSNSYLVSSRYPKFDINDYISAISFNQKHINKMFNYMIGHIKKDSYKPNGISFIIEDLI